MKKTTFFLAIALLLAFTTTTFAQKTQTKAFNKKVSEEFEEQDGRYNVWLDRTEDFKMTSVKYDTIRDVDGKGGLIRTVIPTITTVTIPKGKKGVLVWETDNMGLVTFDAVEKQGLVLPFITVAGGKGNSSNNMVLQTDSVCGTDYAGLPIPCKPSAKIITLGSADDEDLATYKFDGQKPKLVYKLTAKMVNKKVKVKAHGKKANK